MNASSFDNSAAGAEPPCTLAQLNHAACEAFTGKLAHIFESSSWVARATWPRRPFRDSRHLHQAMGEAVRGASPELQMALVQAHPDLAGRLARERRLTVASAREQASAGLDQLSEAELGRFQELNASYRARFGFPFIVCARLSDKAAILRGMETRLGHTPAEEFATALAEIDQIAWLRIQDLLGAA